MYLDMEIATTPSPYERGIELSIFNHTPPLPYGALYKSQDPVRTPVRGLVDSRYEPLVDHMSFVVSNPRWRLPRPVNKSVHPNHR